MSDKTKAELVRENMRLKMELQALKARQVVKALYIEKVRFVRPW